jgi:hypothetical protein
MGDALENRVRFWTRIQSQLRIVKLSERDRWSINIKYMYIYGNFKIVLTHYMVYYPSSLDFSSSK